MTVFTANAKINLSLSIISKTGNGYHSLDSLVVHSVYGDTLEFKPTDDKNFSVEIIGEFAKGLDTTNNSVLDAANLLHSLFPDMPYQHITLTKNLPVASGIGGGSSDCACTIQALLQIWGKTAPDTLKEAMLTLGADVPVSYEKVSCIMRGIGGDITPHKVAKMYIVLCNPKIGVSTVEVFGYYNERFSEEPTYGDFSDRETLIDFLNTIGNDLIKPAIRACPQIKEVLKSLQPHRPLYIGMSGSGGTCYALCEDKEQADILANHCIEQGYWAVSTTTL